MRLFRTGSKACLLGSALLFSGTAISNAKDVHKAHSLQESSQHHASTTHTAQHIHHSAGAHHAAVRHVAAKSRAGRHASNHRWGISCVPYARQVSGIAVVGNAWQWWEKAAGEYARGHRPEPGSVLNFRSNGRMPLGHVAVVNRIINPREIIIDQANWPIPGMRGGVSHNVAVVDVSEANNWSAVRVELGHNGKFGSVYPTYGFIYNRPDPGIVTAAVTRPAPQPVINPVPSDLRPAAEQPWQTFEEVAETPASKPKRIELKVSPSAARVDR